MSTCLAPRAPGSVTGPMTVEVDLKHPWVAFPSHLYSYGRLGIEAEAQLHAGANCFKDMIGTGPFMYGVP